jgi:hypothetical protein
MPQMSLDASDAAELAELLQFLSQWLSRDPARLGASLEEFVGHPAYGTAQLQQDLDGSPSCSGAMTASPCPAPARPSQAHDQPAARAQEPRRRRLRRRSPLPARRAGYGAAPPASGRCGSLVGQWQAVHRKIRHARLVRPVRLTGSGEGQLFGCGRAERGERGCSGRFHTGGLARWRNEFRWRGRSRL